MPEKQLVPVLAIFNHRGLPRFAFTDHWLMATVLEPLAILLSPLATPLSPATGHSLLRGEPHHSPRIGFVFDPQARFLMTEPLAANSLALIPDWLCLALFAASGTRLATPFCACVHIPHSHSAPLAGRHSLHEEALVRHPRLS